MIARCSKGNLTVPQVDLESVESTTAQYIGDNSFRCRALAYQLHTWVVELSRPEIRAVSRSDIGVVLVQCRGKGVLKLSEKDPGAAEATSLSVNIAATKRCLEFVHSFWREISNLHWLTFTVPLLPFSMVYIRLPPCENPRIPVYCPNPV